MNTEQEKIRRDWRLPDELWARIVPLLPPRKPPPLGCHRPRVDDRRAMDAICFVLRTGCQWNALHHTRLCSSSAAHRRFQEGAAAGVFVKLWQCGLAAYDALQGLDWEWLARDGAMTKAPLGGENGGQEPHRSREAGTKRRLLTDGGGVPIGRAVEGANRHDGKMGQEPLASIPVARPEPTPAPPRGWAWTKAMTMTRAVTCSPSSASPPTSVRGGKRPKR